MENLVTHNIMPGKAKVWRIYNGNIIENDKRIEQTMAEFPNPIPAMREAFVLNETTPPGKYSHVCIFNDRPSKNFINVDEKTPPFPNEK